MARPRAAEGLTTGSIADTWGSTPAECARGYPCDRWIPHAEHAYFRAVDVDASAAVVFRWLCQLKAGPYSYDWIDNCGRTSPRELTPGLERLEIGEPVMAPFTLAEFEYDRHLTLRSRPGASLLFGELAVSYVVVPAATGGSRLLVKIVARYPRGPLGCLLRTGLPWGDLIMMRKQLLTLKALAERQAHGASPSVI